MGKFRLVFKGPRNGSGFFIGRWGRADALVSDFPVLWRLGEGVDQFTSYQRCLSTFPGANPAETRGEVYRWASKG